MKQGLRIGLLVLALTGCATTQDWEPPTLGARGVSRALSVSDKLHQEPASAPDGRDQFGLRDLFSFRARAEALPVRHHKGLIDPF